MKYGSLTLLIILFFTSGCSKKSNPSPKTVVVSTLAQGPSADTSDGLKGQATLDGFWAITVDANNNIYVTDDLNSVIKVTQEGIASAFSNSVTNQYGTLTTYSNPLGVAADRNNNIYVSYLSGNVVAKVTPNGQGTLFAGNGQLGSTNGFGIAATFRQPTGLATDGAGNVYVAELCTIRKISTAGLVTTFAGIDGKVGNTDGPALTAIFNSPDGIAVDANNNVYVADTYNNEIRKIEDGIVTTIAGNGTVGSTNGTGKNATFNAPVGIAVDASGNIYVADTGNNLIRKITQSGEVSTLAGTGEAGFLNGPAEKAMFNLPHGTTIGPDGNLYVADSNNFMIRKITLN